MAVATLYADATGRILRVTANPAQDAKYGPPPGTVRQLAFDAATNPGVLAQLAARRARYTLGAGPPVRLLLDGTPVAVNPPGPAALLRARCFDPSPLVVLDAQEIKALGRLVFRLLDGRPD